jgi:RND family efflux transporter MFP subunit
MFWRSSLSLLPTLVLPILLVACSKKAVNDSRVEAPLVRIATVRAATLSARSFTGTVAPRVQSDLGFRVSGKVLERLVDAGQSVKRGQVLMRIDPVDLRLAEQAQQQVVAAARAKARQTAEDEVRYRGLRGTGAISNVSYDQVKAAADAAQAEFKATVAQANVARNASRYAELVADGDSVVMETLAEPGQVVNTGQAVVRLAHAGPREAVVQLPETLRPELGSSALATLFGSERASAPAKLRQLSNSADRLTRTFEARYVLEGQPMQAPLGATVTLRIPDDLKAMPEGHLQVPIGALFDAGQGPGVWVVDGDPAKVTWRPVAVLHLDDDSASVGGSLRQGERIVAVGAHLLHDGMRVRVAAQERVMSGEGARP